MTGATTTGPATSVGDVRRIPLDKLAAEPDDATRRIVPPADASRVPVAAFQSSI